MEVMRMGSMWSKAREPVPRELPCFVQLQRHPETFDEAARQGRAQGKARQRILSLNLHFFFDTCLQVHIDSELDVIGSRASEIALSIASVCAFIEYD